MAIPLTHLIQEVQHSPHSAFYSDLWGSESDELHTLATLPLLSRDIIAQTPFNSRLYIPQGLVTKIVRTQHTKSFLIAKTRANLAEDRYAPRYAFSRPFVYTKNPHDAIDCGLSLYQHGLLPLVAEDNQSLSFTAAERYGVDAFIADTTALLEIIAHAWSPALRERVTTIIYTDHNFEEEVCVQVRTLFPNAHIIYTLFLPESGPLAYSCTQSTIPHFHPTPYAHCAYQSHELILTRLSLLPTPLINYKTGVSCTHYTDCARGHGFILSTP